MLCRAIAGLVRHGAPPAREWRGKVAGLLTSMTGTAVHGAEFGVALDVLSDLQKAELEGTFAALHCIGPSMSLSLSSSLSWTVVVRMRTLSRAPFASTLFQPTCTCLCCCNMWTLGTSELETLQLRKAPAKASAAEVKFETTHVVLHPEFIASGGGVAAGESMVKFLHTALSPCNARAEQYVVFSKRVSLIPCKSSERSSVNMYSMHVNVLLFNGHVHVRLHDSAHVLSFHL